MEIKMITDWSEVTLEMLDKLQNVDMTSEFARAEIISILSGVDVDTILALDNSDYVELVNKTEFISKLPEKRIPEEKLTIKDRTFIATLAPSKMKAGQFLDYKIILTLPDVDKKTARLMACFLTPEGHTYGADTYDKNEMIDFIWKNMTVVEVTSYSNFFTIQLKAFSTAILKHSMRKLKKDKKMKAVEKKEALKRIQETIAIINDGGLLP